MSRTNRQLVLANRPLGICDNETVRLEEVEIADPGDGEALLAVRYLSMDPTIRTWMNDAPGYLPPIGLGEVIRGAGIGEVIASNTNTYSEGDLVFGLMGWQEFATIAGGQEGFQKIPEGIPATLALNLFGVTGMTAYFGLLDVGGLQEGDTVVVSGAAGATGSTVGQIAKLKGAGTVVGLAGTDEKCRWIVDELGFDHAINYKTESVPARLRETCPQGIDLYFDNVGGEILNDCLARLAMRGRVVLCGAIAGYNDEQQATGPANYTNLIIKRGRMEGFIILDYVDRFAEAQMAIAGWLGEGSIHSLEHVVDGLESCPDALNLLFTGGNTGKVLVKL
jgi:NADPH-dependent curcumin reductase